MMKRTMQRGMFAAAMAAALGFGGAQAFASPGAAAQGERACSQPQCDESCRARGATGGQCVMGGCMCYVELPPAS
jgi:hypothetical protein